ncbi:MAG: pentapeptide repeat-containing protein, partial [Microcystis panniformis]
EVVIGGIYSLERIAKDSPKDQWTIMEVLTSYIRKNSPIPSNIQQLEPEERQKALEKLPSVSIPVQAALTVIGRRKVENDQAGDNLAETNDFAWDNLAETTDFSKIKILDLSRTNLRGANLNRANLYRANLWEANLNGAYLNRANLIGANLIGADLIGADLKGADLKGADLNLADLKGADLIGANLIGANLNGAENLYPEQIKSACFWEKAIHTQAKWDGDKQFPWVAEDPKANQREIDKLKRDKNSDPPNPIDCNTQWEWGLRQKVRAKHSDRKSPVSPIGYAQMLRPYRTRADEDARFGSTILSKSCTCFAKKDPKTLTSSIFHIYSASPI